MINRGEKRLYEWQFGLSGHFFKNLFDAIANADLRNLEKLEKGFPEEVEAYRKFISEEGYWQNLVKKIKGGIGF